MRLLQLKIKNIASLRGDHLINFAGIHQQSPLFAITGETGAGKSTILNSIGLALYGKIYKTQVNQNDVVTIGEKEGQIELLFEAKGKIYLAYWRARVLKANGETYSTPQSPIRELYEVAGTDFSSPRHISEARVDDILNLDYDQFCKCVILNQGEFARFLTSSFNERKDILEKLYPGEVLESLGRELKSQTEGLAQEKSYLERDLLTLKGDGLQGENLKAESFKTAENLKNQEALFGLFEKLSFHFTSVCSYHQKNSDYHFRVTETKKEFAQETTRFNGLLKSSEESHHALKLVQREMQERWPRLQELLKLEVELAHLQETKRHAEKTSLETQKKLEDIENKTTSTKDQVQELEKKSNELKSSFHHSLSFLNECHDKLSDVFDLWAKRQQYASEIEQKEEALGLIAKKGKELSLELKTLEDELKLLPENGANELEVLQEKRKNFLKLQEVRSRHEAALIEAQKEMQRISQDSHELEKKMMDLEKITLTYQQELSPLATSLKLQEVLSAVKICLGHEESKKKGECPVCTTPLSESKWSELEVISSKNDFGAMEKRAREIERALIQIEEELKIAHKLKTESILAFNHKKAIETQCLEALKNPLPSFEDLDREIEKLQKDVWSHEKLSKDLRKITLEIESSRENWKQLKADLLIKQTKMTSCQEDLDRFKYEFQNHLLQGLSDEVIDQLKKDAKNFNLYQQHDMNSQKLTQQLDYLLEQKDILTKDLDSTLEKLKLTQARFDSVKLILDQELGHESASALIEKWQKNLKEHQERHEVQEQALKQQENKLKEYQSKLYAFDEQLKDIEVQFAKEVLQVKELAQSLHLVGSEMSLFLKKLSQLSLSLSDPHELFLPLKDRLESEASLLKNSVLSIRSELSAINARLQDWESKLDKIQLIELKLKEISEKLGRLQRLSEVLGKDELRSFVLSMVEENLIRQTNKELLRLCQGRYEIIHQNRGLRLQPEFYILDKFREGGRRKVSTLSGGETFMVSLAMALGLAEMTRGQAEIDTLFIDEGFGTLDQECLEDVLEVLGQIQTRGLMVGVISHIKSLTQSVPVNLVLSKKTDGTSTIGLKFN